MRVTLGASRLQEILADRFAALSYGAKAFAEGLTHVIKKSIEFDRVAGEELHKAIEKNIKPTNFYQLKVPKRGKIHDEIKNAFESEMNHPASAYDSHPSPKQRIELVKKLDLQLPNEQDDKPTWDLLPERPVLEELMMTRTVHKSMLGRIELQNQYKADLEKRRKVAFYVKGGLFS